MNRHKIITLFSIMICFCLISSTAISLFCMRQISKEHTTEFLKVLSDDIYHSISDELKDTVNNAKVVANDSLLIDLLEQENAMERSEIEDKLTSYTLLLEKEFSYSWVFIVSDQTKAYYSDTGIYRFINPVNEEDDEWYDNFVSMNTKYDLSIGRDNDIPDVWTVFVDARIENEDGRFLGVCGMALELTNLQERIRNYEDEYGIQIFFVDQNGETQFGSSSIQDDPEQRQLPIEQEENESTTIKKSKTNINYTITKYINELDWYMMIENINPYNYTVDYTMIGLNVATFFLFLIIAAVSLHFISKRTGTLLTDSYQDNLTGLFNRRAFDERMNSLRKQDTLGNLIIAVFDINALKKANDLLGHSAGDELITAGAQLIQKVFGPYGECYRTGGDEFVVIFAQLTENIDLLTKQFERAISEWHGKQVETISISYGISCSANQDCTVDELLCNADEQMYHKKKEYYHKKENDRRK